MEGVVEDIRRGIVEGIVEGVVKGNLEGFAVRIKLNIVER